MTRHILAIFSVCLISTSLGCDAQDAPAANAEAKPAEDPIAIEVARIKAEREAKKKAEEEAEKARLDTIDQFATIPEGTKAPKNVEKACAAMAEANDAYMHRLYTGDAITKWEGAKSTQLAMMKANCIKGGSIAIAQCQALGMAAMTEEFKKDLPDLLGRCIEKYKESAAPADGEEKAAQK